MEIIYRPAGKALEYSPWACNLWRGCAHGCRYCYVPTVLRMNLAEFCAAPTPRKGVLEALDRQLRRISDKPREILLSFTSDPYQPAEAEARVTRRALELLHAAGHQAVVLTKNPRLALRDLDLLLKARTILGITALFIDEADRERWEPGAPPMAERFAALAEAKAAGLRTWVSVEPVIDPAQALAVIERLAPVTDRFKVGKLNHFPEIERRVDWRRFLADAIGLLKRLGADYYIKRDLATFGEGRAR